MATDIVTYDLIRELCQTNDDPTLSLYMPTHRTGREMRQDRVRFKNLLQRSIDALSDYGLRRPEAESFLEPADSLLKEDAFWEHCDHGLAALLAPAYHRILRLPESFKESLHVGQRFCIKPLLPLLGRDHEFFVLALTTDSARLYRANSVDISEVELPDIRKIEVDGDDETLQFHAHGPARAKGSTDEVMYHGHGTADDRDKADTEKFFQRVSTTVARALPANNGPLVLACVGYLASMYEKANTYRKLLKVKIPGNPDRWSLEELRQQAWRLAEPYFQQSEREAMATFLANRASELASADIGKIALAARHGRIDTLFIQPQDERWGKLRSDDSSVDLVQSPNDGAVELLDFAAKETILNGGNVYAVADLPETESPVAALMRY